MIYACMSDCNYLRRYAMFFVMGCLLSCSVVGINTAHLVDTGIDTAAQAQNEGLSAVVSFPENHDEELLTESTAVDIRHDYNYRVRGKNYNVFANAKNFQEIGIASWYGPGFHGKKTANGERYNMYAMTAAHKTLPLGSRVQVTHLTTGKTVIVRINDRGPFHGGRIIDLSKKAARKLGILKTGSARVHVKALQD